MPEPMITPARSQVDLRRIDAGIGHGVHTSGDAVMDELVDAPGILGRKVFRQLEALHCPAEAAGKLSGVVTGDRSNAADAVDDISPGALTGCFPPAR